MKGGEQCLFRYYEILPLDFEPEYKLGYTCDMCSKDFSKTPFFHCAQTGRDLCMACGENLALNQFSALICRMMAPNILWKDSQKDIIVVFCYQIQFEYFGCHFSDGSNLLIACEDELPSFYIEVGISLEKATTLRKAELLMRFPWSNEALKMSERDCICFYRMTKCLDRPRPCFLTSFRQDGLFIEFCFSDGFSEILHCGEGVVLVVKGPFVISCLVMNLPLRWGKSLPKAAASLLEWFLSGD
ncbi:kinetoplastid kinetochore protein 20 [Trypanosoma cruzi]|uniref:Kinetoplastid kinetochore protein 20 n=2 Tax=Trypanosoma cruzi TaxID=5693 RepID=Q4D6Y7_TRYCC|nr:uncharacterized protein Tc00.1047053506053.20 [Trypanosoma cruzi]EAN88288.1 hypothetical protein, conserved [Trypanosoma cruzi]PWV10692.1 kinetoplastid kinetochore protein 20 [Trypanosoma cruzi]RNC45835.1 hypothetical protein TcCL_NonESM04365 [Trypanosoma cruzi]|eukprot:XP_810139.1 hypothetical protein Tc00.1047053506053.20 [Trypanosoma cruzi strain CL Brener]